MEEPNPSGGSYFTNYTYDVLDHLVRVDMPRPTGTQTRTFTYNNTAFLQSATNPENGTVTYTYDSQKRLSTVVDAKNQKKVFTYDSYNRVTQVSRYVYSGGAYVEDPMQRTNFYYDSNPFGTSQNIAGRLAAVQYYGGHCSSYQPSGTQSGCDTIQEWYSYNSAGAMLNKTLKVTRGSSNRSLTASWAYDTEGRVTDVTYPSSSAPGSHYTFAYDTLGRLNTMTDARNSRTLISGVTYGVANEIQQITSAYTAGVNSETRGYNGMFQLTQLQVGSALNISYTYSATQNNGKILSQNDAISGEEIDYAYDALNRLASAVTADNPNVTQWGQSYTYDGFGNLTDQTLIKGTAPNVHVAYDPATNRQVGDTADLNGNIGLGYIYDLENRLVQPGSSSTARYAYDAGNHRVWRGDTGVDELAFWSGSQKLATYQISTSGGLSFTLSKTNVYFGGKLISRGTYNPSGTGDKVTLTPVAADRLGSIGKFYPYGTERPSATMNDTEKFTGYLRDASTGLDYADQRYHQPGMGRFMTPDSAPSARVTDPGSWNRYAYVGGDPINSVDPSGQYWIDVGFPNLFVWQPGIQDVAWLNVCDYYCEAGWAAAEYYLNLANQYNSTFSTLQEMQGEGLVDGYNIDFWSGTSTVSLSSDYSQFFQYLQNCGCTPVDWGGAWDDVIGAIDKGTFVIKNVPVLVLAGLQTIFKKEQPVGRPKQGLPAGTKPIDEMGWDKDRIHDIKDGVGARAPDWVGIDPDGNVWTGSPSGEAINHGPWGPYTNH